MGRGRDPFGQDFLEAAGDSVVAAFANHQADFLFKIVDMGFRGIRMEPEPLIFDPCILERFFGPGRGMGDLFFVAIDINVDEALKIQHVAGFAGIVDFAATVATFAGRALPVWLAHDFTLTV